MFCCIGMVQKEFKNILQIYDSFSLPFSLLFLVIFMIVNQNLLNALCMTGIVLGSGGNWQWIHIHLLLPDCSMSVVGKTQILKQWNISKSMVIESISQKFSQLEQECLVTVKMTITSFSSLRDRRRNKTKTALTLHFVTGTRTYGKWDAFTRFFRSWQDEEATEIKKKQQNKTPRVASGSQVSVTS